MNVKFHICTIPCIAITLVWSQNVQDVNGEYTFSDCKESQEQKWKNGTKDNYMGYFKYLLKKGVCMRPQYTNEVGESDTINVNFTNHQVISMDESQKSVTVGVKYSVRWADPMIFANFTEKERIPIYLPSKHMWYPNLYFLNCLASKPEEPPLWHGTVTLLPNNATEDESALIMVTGERLLTIFCNDLSYVEYPRDRHRCEVRVGLRPPEDMQLVLDNPECTSGEVVPYEASGFKINTRFHTTRTNDSIVIGFDIHLNRITKSIFLKHYFPCIAIVFISQISFIVPSSCIPGRISLVITNFLTMTNIFIGEMVRI